MKHKVIDFSEFPPERELQLRSITRYSMFEVMYYRSNLWMHTHRMLWMLEEAAELAQKLLNIDIDRARILALVHDDAEMITGDYQAGHKFFMSKAELELVADAEAKAIEVLSKKYPPKVNGYSYHDLLVSALRKDDNEGQVVMYFDKLDAFCESLHEVLAGNILFVRSILFYQKAMTEFPIKFPLIADFLNSKKSPLTYTEGRESPLNVAAERYRRFNTPHTHASIQTESDFTFYNTWRKIIIERAGDEGKRWLTEQKER